MKYLRKFLAAIVLFVSLAALAPLASAQKYFFYVGTYTDGTKSKGIYAFRYDAASKQVTPLGLAAESANPSFLAISPNGKFLYAVNELQNYKGPNSGGVSAFSIDKSSGKLTFLNEVPSRGADPCYITVDKTGKWVLVANYTGGSIAVFPVQDDGTLGEASGFVQHTGHGPNKERQEGPHAHSIDLSPDNRFAFVDDLGLDSLLTYKFDAKTGKLSGVNTLVTHFNPGAGPRHFALHPSGKFAYVVAEMGHTVTALAANLEDGTFQTLQSLSTIPPDYKDRNDDAEVEVDPSGRFLYASNRGHDSIIGFAIDPNKGTLSPLGYVSKVIKEPRSFEIDPTGKLLFAENQKSDNIVLFQINAKTGALMPTEREFSVPSPVCLKFLKVP
jgi:6-phosphogluconolactonase